MSAGGWLRGGGEVERGFRGEGGGGSRGKGGVERTEG